MKLSPSDVAPVQEFLTAESELKEFVAQHDKVFDQYRSLVERRNAALENADKAVRATKGDECGPFKVSRTTTEYKPEILYEELGRETFLQLGGKIDTKTVYDIDKTRVEAAIARGQALEQAGVQDLAVLQQGGLPKSVVETFRETKVAYTTPKKLVAP